MLFRSTGVLVLNQDGTWNLNPVASGVMTEPGLVMYRFGALLCQCEPVRGRGELSRRTSAFASSLADCRRRGHHASGLLRGARSPGIAADPNQLRNATRLRPDALGLEIRLCPSSRYRGRRPFAHLRPAASRAGGFREAGASLKICGSAIAPRVQLLRAQLRSAVPSDLERLQAVSDVAAR